MKYSFIFSILELKKELNKVLKSQKIMDFETISIYFLTHIIRKRRCSSAYSSNNKIYNIKNNINHFKFHIISLITSKKNPEIRTTPKSLKLNNT